MVKVDRFQHLHRVYGRAARFVARRLSATGRADRTRGISSSVVGIMAGQMIMQGFVGFRIPVCL